jgi:hypothetical protein
MPLRVAVQAEAAIERAMLIALSERRRLSR